MLNNNAFSLYNLAFAISYGIHIDLIYYIYIIYQGFFKGKGSGNFQNMTFGGGFEADEPRTSELFKLQKVRTRKKCIF
ncbi:MAG: hypothetical protein UT09_C0029G0005 [Parcubacteria group bacterium GW2011_GWF2_38_8]|nr:MAG: hypothetical protein UT09_C0029G0005 [Parcubacteria group bacterium GW2011_GWF2_38_8]